MRTLLSLIALLISAVAASPGWAQAGRELVVATTGGTWEKQMRDHFFDPFTKATGIKVVTVSGSDAANVARIKAMVEARNVTIDLYQSGEIQSASESHKALNEDMTEFCRKYQDNKDLLSGACNHAGVLSAYGTTLIVYNKSKFPNGGPKNWTEFWDVKAFPGPRALPSFNDPWRVLAAALMADGVPSDKLFPLDVDRAFRKMDEIKPHVTLWWKTGDQSFQGFRNQEYTAGLIWQTRASALKSASEPLDWSQEQAFLVGDRWGLVKGAPNRDNALKFLDFFLANIDGQAKRCEESTCTPVSRSAAERMSPQARATVPMAPDVLAKLVIPDADWINKNHTRLIERWNAWIAN